MMIYLISFSYFYLVVDNLFFFETHLYVNNILTAPLATSTRLGRWDQGSTNLGCNRRPRPPLRPLSHQLSNDVTHLASSVKHKWAQLADAAEHLGFTSTQHTTKRGVSAVNGLSPTDERFCSRTGETGASRDRCMGEFEACTVAHEREYQ
jgi:hypothetical protein